MPTPPVKRPRPFEQNERLSGGDVETLYDWLTENADPQQLIAVDYTVDDLITDLDSMLTGMWSDGIDARGADA